MEGLREDLDDSSFTIGTTPQSWSHKVVATAARSESILQDRTFDVKSSLTFILILLFL